MAESVLGTLQECGPPFHSSLPCQIQLSARCLAQGPDLGGCAESATGLVSGSVSQCLYLSLLSLVSSLSISISISLFLFISLTVHLCFTLCLLLFMSVFYLLLSSQYVFFSLHLSHFVFILISLCVPVSLPPSLLWVFLSAFFCPGSW